MLDVVGCRTDLTHEEDGGVRNSWVIFFALGSLHRIK